jgi:malate permease and related proteins
MENVNLVFVQTLCMISLGYFLKRIGIIKLEDGKSISKLLMHTTFPALMLVSTIHIDLSPKYLLIPSFCIAYGCTMLTIAFFWFSNYENRLRGILTMAAGGFNVGLFAFPIIESIFGKQALIYAIFYDIGNSVVVFIFIYGIGQYFSSTQQSGVELKKIGKKILSLPPLLAMVLGLFLNFTKIGIPEQALNFLEILSKANKPLVLLLLGIYLKVNLKKDHRIAIAKILTLRYATASIVVFLLYYFLKNSPTEFRILGLCSLLPVGMTLLPFSDEFGYDSEIAGALVNFSLILSFGAMWAFMILF